MIHLNDGLTPEEKLFIKVNSDPQYSAMWAGEHPEEAEKLIEEIRVTNDLQWVEYQLIHTQDKVGVLLR